MLWLKTTNDKWVAEISSIGSGEEPKCPNCNKPITLKQRVKIDKDEEGDIQGWHYNHPCGAKLLIVND